MSSKLESNHNLKSKAELPMFLLEGISTFIYFIYVYYKKKVA